MNLIRRILITLHIIKPNLASNGSAFSKLVEHEQQLTEAKGKIIALDAAHREKATITQSLEVEAIRIHTESAALKSRIEALHASL